MQGQIILFLIAGYETTSTALGFTSHHLAVNPEVQRKLQQEVDEHFPKDVRDILSSDLLRIHRENANNGNNDYLHCLCNRLRLD